MVALGGLCAYYLVKGEVQTAQELADQLVAETNRTSDELHRPWGHMCRGLALHWRGRPSEALEAFEHAMVLYDPSLHQPLVEMTGHDNAVVSRSIGALSLWTLGSRASAREQQGYANPSGPGGMGRVREKNARGRLDRSG